MKPKPSLALIAGAALVSAVTLAGCDRADRERAASSAKQTTRESARAIDDATVTAKVKTALLADKAVGGTAISVETKQGRVTLTGHVPQAQIQRAEEIARGVEGVQGVDNQLVAATS